MSCSFTFLSPAPYCSPDLVAWLQLLGFKQIPDVQVLLHVDLALRSDLHLLRVQGIVVIRVVEIRICDKFIGII